MKIIDITRPIHPGMAIYPNNPEVSFEQTQAADRAAGKNALTKITLGSHTGTHIDTPAHIHPEGAGAFAYPLERFIGLAEVVDLSHCKSVITAGDFPPTSPSEANGRSWDKGGKGGSRLLIKTRNSSGDPDTFDDDFVALDDSAAEEIVRRGIKLVGLDALSIRKRGTKNQVHETLIDNDVIIVEGLWLADVDPGTYELICLPLKVDLDGAPVRAILRK